MNKAKFMGKSRRFNKTDERVVGEKHHSGTKDTDIPVGDGKASVSPTRGVKEWFSDRDHGVSVESTMTVQITCGQSEEEIRAAAAKAGQLAMELAHDGLEDMGLYTQKLRR